jgi:hypothetical protein
LKPDLKPCFKPGRCRKKLCLRKELGELDENKKRKMGLEIKEDRKAGYESSLVSTFWRNTDGVGKNEQ